MSKVRDLIFQYLSEEGKKLYDQQLAESEAKFATFSNPQGAQKVGFVVSNIIKNAVASNAVSSEEEAFEILKYSLDLMGRVDALVKEATDNMIAIEADKFQQAQG